MCSIHFPNSGIAAPDTILPPLHCSNPKSKKNKETNSACLRCRLRPPRFFRQIKPRLCVASL